MTTFYQEIERRLNQHLPWQWGCAVRERIARLVSGILLAQSICPSKIAAGLADYGESAAQQSSIERQVRRWENDTRLEQATCLHPLARYHLLWDKPKELILILDATTHTDQQVVLMVSVRYRGRSLPLAWQMWEANQPLQGDRFWKRVADLLRRVADLLPVGVTITWLADRAFGTPHFLDLLVARGWHFIVRVQGQTRYQDVMGLQCRVDALPQGRSRAKGRGKLFKASGWRSLSVVVLLSARYKSPLCLVSDLPPDWSLARLYRLRYNTETLFRDYKSSGWGWEQCQVRDIDHMQRLLLGMALATWFTLLVGTLVADELLSRPPTGRRTTRPPESKQSLFQLGLQRLRRWALARSYPPHWGALTQWMAPNWDDQIAQHHRYAFVMGVSSSIVKVHTPLYATVRP